MSSALLDPGRARVAKLGVEIGAGAHVLQLGGGAELLLADRLLLP
jgi:hypothetical protein